jgi:serine/threonine protein phosphatase 1
VAFTINAAPQRASRIRQGAAPLRHIAADGLDFAGGADDQLPMASRILPPGRLPPGRRRTARGERIYAIGDVHGRYDLLREMLRRIEAHSRGLPRCDEIHVVLLGDVVDRGPDSARVLQFLHEWTRQASGQVLLLGNHEEMMLRTWNGEASILKKWLRVGGRATLESFGLAVPAEEEDIRSLEFVKLVRDAIPPPLMHFVGRWPLHARSGDYYFCHAGVRPGIELDRQSKQDLVWIRNSFLNDQRDHGAVIVHGHSVSPGVDHRPNRIGIDTGAYATGVLTALYAEGGEVDFLSTEPAQPATPLLGVPPSDAPTERD